MGDADMADDAPTAWSMGPSPDDERSPDGSEPDGGFVRFDGPTQRARDGGGIASLTAAALAAHEGMLPPKKKPRTSDAF